jgi:CRP-like cAMP-binding protein
MLAAKPFATATDLKSRFLDGLPLSDLKVVLSAARQREYLANSVVINQGHTADHLFLLTKGRARFFFNTIDGKKVVLL